MKHALTTLLLAIAAVLAILSTPASAVTLTVDGTTWGFCVQPSGEATITNATSVTGSLVIPSTLGGYRVTGISYSAFEACNSLTSVTIPDSVTSIETHAFKDCSALVRAEIRGNVTNDWRTFFTSGTGFAFYSSTSPFAGCNNLATLVLGGKMTKIGMGMFYGCNSLKNVTIPDGVTSIGEQAFGACSNLTRVTMGNSVQSIGSEAFYECCDLTTVKISGSVTSIGNHAFYGCTNLTSVTIPDSVKSIGRSAFSGCSIRYDTNTVPGICLVDGWAVGWTNSPSWAPDLTKVRGIADRAFTDVAS